MVDMEYATILFQGEAHREIPDSIFPIQSGILKFLDGEIYGVVSGPEEDEAAV